MAQMIFWWSGLGMNATILIKNSSDARLQGLKIKKFFYNKHRKI